MWNKLQPSRGEEQMGSNVRTHTSTSTNTSIPVTSRRVRSCVVCRLQRAVRDLPYIRRSVSVGLPRGPSISRHYSDPDRTNTQRRRQPQATLDIATGRRRNGLSVMQQQQRRYSQVRLDCTIPTMCSILTVMGVRRAASSNTDAASMSDFAYVATNNS